MPLTFSLEQIRTLLPRTLFPTKLELKWKLKLKLELELKKYKKDTMTLTEKQKKRIQENRERALLLRRQRLIEQQLQKSQQEKEQIQQQSSISLKRKREDDAHDKNVEKKTIEKKHGEGNDEVEVEVELEVILEDFEQGASEWVSKREAKEIYCLPEGTLKVCDFVEKQNPFHKGFTSMKLYKRSHIRRFARERFGGLEGLIAERKKREMKRYQKDLEDTKDLFKAGSRGIA